MPAYVNDEARWNALIRRDPAAEGTFFYGVATTKIFCRPTCRSRLPLRANVQFFADPAAALAAGFRACKRCTPTDQPHQAQQALVARVVALIEAAEVAPSLAELAAEVGLSVRHLQQQFTALVGISPHRYAEQLRRQRLAAALRSERSISAAIYAAGYQSAGHFYAHAEQELGMSPRQFRSGAAGEAVRYAVAACPLGSVLVATTERGICAIELADTAEEALVQLQARLPKAQLHADQTELAELLAAVVALIDDPGSQFDLPLDLRGTAFQQRVWAALRNIPAGTTISYRELAERIGQPTASRAVAQAVGANRVAVAIPCHRVIGSDQALHGYRWGVARKQALLRREAVAE